MGKKFQGQIVHEGIGKVDSLDMDIIKILGANCRISNSYISKVLSKRPDKIKYRIDRMQERGIVPGYMTHIDLEKLGFMSHLVMLKLNDFSGYDDLLKKLEQMDDLTILQIVGGNWDIRAYFANKSIRDFKASFDNLLTMLSQHLKEYMILQITKNEYVGIKLFGQAEIKGQYRVNRSSYHRQLIEKEKEYDMDEKDMEILAGLRNDARMSIRELSEKVGLSTTACDNRLRHLTESKIIKSFFPQVSLFLLGYEWYKILLRVNPDAQDRFSSYITQHPNTTFYTNFIGEYNFQVSIFAHDQKDFYDAMRDIRTRFSGDIMDYQTLIVFEQKKNDLSLSAPSKT